MAGLMENWIMNGLSLASANRDGQPMVVSNLVQMLFLTPLEPVASAISCVRF